MTTTFSDPCAAARPKSRTAPAPQGRTLRGYLLVPRPKDLIKAVVLPVSFAVGAVSGPGVSGADVAKALAVWVALELLVYQARYQWNDIRGFAADQSHPDSASRGRLPGPLGRARPHIAASAAVALLRMALVAVLALAVPALSGVLLAMTVGVWGAALLYERIRSAATGREELPVPLRPALLALWVVVGAGYAVRGLTGLALAVDLRPGLVAAAAVAMWSLGVVFVTCRWSLEAMSFARFDGGRVSWHARPDQAREHTLGLVRWLPRSTDARDLGDEASPDCWRALRGRTPLTAPWNLAMVVAGSSALLTGLLLDGPTGAVDSVVAATAGGATVLAVLLLARHRRLAATAAGVLLVGLQAVLGAGSPVLATVPWLVVLGFYGCFTSQCAQEIGHPLHRFTR